MTSSFSSNHSSAKSEDPARKFPPPQAHSASFASPASRMVLRDAYFASRMVLRNRTERTVTRLSCPLYPCSFVAALFRARAFCRTRARRGVRAPSPIGTGRLADVRNLSSASSTSLPDRASVVSSPRRSPPLETRHALCQISLSKNPIKFSNMDLTRT